MIAEQNNYVKSVASGLKQLTDDEKVRLACEARQFALMDQRSNYKAGIAEAEKRLIPIIQEKKLALAERDSTIAEKDSALAEKDSALAEKDSTIAEDKLTIAERDAEILRLKALLQQK